MKNKRFLIASGGTGGHFYPGFALGMELQKQGNKVLFAIRKNDPAAAVLKENGLQYTELALSGGLPRSFNPVRHVRFVKGLIKSLFQTRDLLREFKPNVTLGMGGYVSFPLVFCSRLAGIKTAVHESNAIWGLSNRLCGLFATVRLLGLPMNKPYKNAVLTSTPVRAEFACPVNPAEVLRSLGLSPTARTILVMGGSQGAKGINKALPAVIKKLPEWQFIHVTGTRWYEAQQALYKGLPNVCALPYSNEVYKLMKAANLMICRSGASTLAELIACRLPAVLVPFPHAAADHQFYNAKILADSGCARIVTEGENLAERLHYELQTIDATALSSMCKHYETLSVPNPLAAVQQITDVLKKL